MSKDSEEYKQAFEAGRQSLIDELASDPAALVKLLPNLQSEAQKRMQEVEGDLTADQKALLNKAMKGDMRYKELINSIGKIV